MDPPLHEEPGDVHPRISVAGRYPEGFFAMAALPLAVAAAGGVAIMQASIIGLLGLATLAVAACLGEVLIWRALRHKWEGRQDTLSPWSARLTEASTLIGAFAVLVAAGTPKAHGIRKGSWPDAALFAALCYGSVFALAMIAVGVEWLVKGRGRSV